METLNPPVVPQDGTAVQPSYAYEHLVNSKQVHVNAFPIDKSGWPLNKEDVIHFSDQKKYFVSVFNQNRNRITFQDTNTQIDVYFQLEATRNLLFSCSPEGLDFRLFLLKDTASKHPIFRNLSIRFNRRRVDMYP